MSKVRVYEVAKQLNMDQKTLVALFQSMGIGDVRNHMSAVESDVVERVKRHLERQKTPEVVEERVRSDGRVVKRQRRPAEGEAGVPAPRPSTPSSQAATDVSSARGAPSASPSQARYDVPEAPGSTPAHRRSPSAQPSSHGDHDGSGHDGGLAHASHPAPSARSHEPGHPGGHPQTPAPEPSRGEVAVHEPAQRPEPHLARESARGDEPARPVAPEIVEAHAAHAAHVPAAPASAAKAPKSRAAGSREDSRPKPGAVPAMEMFEPPPPAKVAGEAPSKGEISSGEPSPVEHPAIQARSGEGPTGPAAEHHEPAPANAEAPAPSRPALAPPPLSTEPAVIPAAPPAPKVVAPPPSPAPPRPAEPTRAETRVAPRPTHERVSPTPQMSQSNPPPGLRRPSQPPNANAPKTGIETWGGRPGVPMPAARTASPQQRRTVYDPRAASPQVRPGAPAYGPGAGRGPQRPGMGGRPGQGRFPNRPGMSSGPRKPSMVSTQEMSSHKKVVKIEEQVTLKQLADKMSVKATDVLMKLLSLGMTGVHINSTLDADTAKILANEFGWAVEDVAVSEETQLGEGMEDAAVADVEQLTRPPIVTVMGHVDHGKTSLLDRIRKATVAEGEAGGITQHIGAYRVETTRGTIAFLDTPGHEAFTEMRARGAKVTDIVILVVAADDGVMPQTKEAINHAQAAKVPIVVAINKIDKPGADPEKIKRELASQFNLQPEEWGGDTMFREVSAKTGQGIDELLETVLLQAEVLELKANPKKRASGTVIEALLDRGRGPVARIIVQDGTLHTGDTILVGAAWGKVRAMTDELGRTVAEAGPATPVEVQGLNEVPSAGDPVHAVKDARTAEEIAETRRKKASKTLIPQDSRISLDALADRLREADQLELKLIIKGDVQGSVEAVSHALAKLSAQKVKVTIVHAGVGGITEGDVNLAVASRAVIVGFNVRPAGKAASLAESEGIEIRLYNIIYNAVDDIHAAMEGLLPATKVEKGLGKAEVRQVFPVIKVGLVAGCMVLTGVIKRTADARLIRDSVVVWTGKLSGLRRFKDDAREVQEGFECGISLESFRDIKPGDIIESFEIEEIKTKLT
jgi:translation initiation factor IF-2